MTDPVVLALPGALPVMNREAVELSMLVGLALGCAIARTSKWDRKSYFYPDLPKAYQISQYDLPICFDGAVDVPSLDEHGEIDPDGPTTRVGIVRAHLEEDAGKLAHEAPGGGAIEGSIVDLNRAGTPLLEIVTAPDFASADACVAFCRLLRQTCRHLGATLGVLQAGHVRFEPNINCELTLADGRTVRTPITEVKNLNSYRSVRGAIEHEIREQPKRWLEQGGPDGGLVFGPGTKTTRGWDDNAQRTVLQREKEDAHDYRYFPDPDLPPVTVDDEWLARVRTRLVELPLVRMKRYTREFGLDARSARVLCEERADADFFDAAVAGVVEAGDDEPIDAAAKGVSNLLLQVGARLSNERGVLVSDLGIAPAQAATVVAMRAQGEISSNAADELFEALCAADHAGQDPRALAQARGLIAERDEGKLSAWCDEAIEANPGIADDVRAGKVQAVGRLIGDVRQRSGGSADAKAVRAMLLDKLGRG